MNSININKKVAEILHLCVSYYLEFMYGSFSNSEIKLNIHTLYISKGGLNIFREYANSDAELKLDLDSIYFLTLVLKEIIKDEFYELDTFYSIEKKELENYLKMLESKLNTIFIKEYSNDTKSLTLDINQSYWVISEYIDKIYLPMEYQIYKDYLVQNTSPFTSKKELKITIDDYRRIIKFDENIGVYQAFQNYISYFEIYLKKYTNEISKIGLLEISDNFEVYSPKLVKWIESCRFVNKRNVFEDEMWSILEKE